MSKTDKITRMLLLYHKLLNGEVINKSKFINENNITIRTFARDIDDIRIFLSEIYSSSEVIFDKSQSGYYLTGYTKYKFPSTKIIILLKILLDSRTFDKDDLSDIMNMLIKATPIYEQASLKLMIENELKNYIPIQNANITFNKIWNIERSILRKEKIRIEYTKANHNKVFRDIIPIAITFSEFYFYLIAFLDNSKFETPTFFRIDRILSFEIIENCKNLEIYNKINPSDIKNKLHYMQGGDYMDIKFKFWGESIDAVLDRLPQSKIISKNEDRYIVEAKVFGRGIKMWLLSQAEFLEVIEPLELRDDIKNTLSKMLINYK